MTEDSLGKNHGSCYLVLVTKSLNDVSMGDRGAYYVNIFMLNMRLDIIQVGSPPKNHLKGEGQTFIPYIHTYI